MPTQDATIAQMYQQSGIHAGELSNADVAHLVVHHNKVLGSHGLPGLDMNVREFKDGISAVIRLQEGVCIEKPVHLCFGMLPEKGIQKIEMEVTIEKNSSISLQAHCTFPNSVDIRHIMDASIYIGENARYTYTERHIHGSAGGTRVSPTARVVVDRGASFKTEFELLRGRVGELEIDYETRCKRYSSMEMTARINASGRDRVRLDEKGLLLEEGARGVLTSRIALRDMAEAEVLNTIHADAPFTRGHVDCKEIIRGKARARAVPVVAVAHPKAHVTHEAAIGSVDNKQLETLLARGLTEDQAVDLIIQGLLS